MPQQQELGSYGQFCPVAMAAEIVCSRWTALIVREMLCGSTRFNDLRRGVPLMSPTLLSKRLKELEHAGVIAAVPTGQAGVFDYKLTEAGEDLRPVVMSLGIWGQRWVDSNLTLRNLDPSLLMWDMRRSLDPTPLPPRRCTINFLYPEVPPAKRSWWLVVDGKVDLCSDRSRLRRRSLREEFAAQHDVRLDGPLHRAERDQRGPDGADRRQDRRALDAAMAGPEPLRQGKEARVADNIPRIPKAWSDARESDTYPDPATSLPPVRMPYSRDELLAAQPRYGTANPEPVENELWDQAIKEDWSGYALRQHLGVDSTSGHRDHAHTPSTWREATPGPFWSWRRFGRTSTALGDGRVIHVAGEHEDFYDPDFCIYNDVVVDYAGGRREFFLYPKDIFPPTDSHSATLVGRDLFLIGSLGYHDLRRPGETQVLKLDTRSLRIERVATCGENPGWISDHHGRTARSDDDPDRRRRGGDGGRQPAERPCVRARPRNDDVAATGARRHGGVSGDGERSIAAPRTRAMAPATRSAATTRSGSRWHSGSGRRAARAFTSATPPRRSRSS